MDSIFLLLIKSQNYQMYHESQLQYIFKGFSKLFFRFFI